MTYSFRLIPPTWSPDKWYTGTNRAALCAQAAAENSPAPWPHSGPWTATYIPEGTPIQSPYAHGACRLAALPSKA